MIKINHKSVKIWVPKNIKKPPIVIYAHGGAGFREDPKINIRIKLSALWATAMLCYTYCDFLGLFMPGFIGETLKGNMGFQGPTTQIKMFLGALVMSTPAIMVFLSLILKPKINRIINIILSIVHTLLMLATFFMQPWYYYFYFGIIEIVLTLSIVWYAFKWPRNISEIN